MSTIIMHYIWIRLSCWNLSKLPQNIHAFYFLENEAIKKISDSKDSELEILKTELKTKDDRLQESERHLLLSTKGKMIYVLYINVHVIMCVRLSTL